MVEIVVAVITSLCTLIGVIVTVVYSNKKTEKKLTEQTELTLYRIEQLELKQEKHNKLIERMYRLEDKVAVDEEKLKVVNHRIADLEGYHK